MINQPKILFLERSNAVSILKLYQDLKTDLPNFKFSLLKVHCQAADQRIIRHALFVPLLMSDTLRLIFSFIYYKPDIIIINFPDPVYFYIKIFRYLISAFNIKIVKINHELQSSLAPRLMRQNRFLNVVSDTQVFVSKSAQIDYETRELACKAAIVIRNPVSILSTAAVVTKPKFRCVFASRLDDNKGADLALTWFQQIYAFDNRYRMLFIGSGALQRALQCTTRSMNLSDVVQFQPALPREQLHGLIRESQFLFTPSKYESFNVTLGEALLLGCRVIASDIPAHNEFKSMVSSGLFLVPRLSRLPNDILKVAKDANCKVSAVESEVSGAGYAAKYRDVFTDLFHIQTH